MKSALILAPHPDDGEFSSGGSIKKLSDGGTEFWYIAFSPCTQSVPKGFKEDVLYEELKRAVAHLSIPQERIRTYDFPVRHFPAHRQDILEAMVQLKKELAPNLVLLPNSRDIHQDHKVIHEEGIRAFKDTNLLGYELPWNSFSFRNDFFIKLEKKHMDAKWKAIEEYRSQEFRKYHNRELFDGLARVRGAQANAEFAEAFEMMRWLI